METIQKNSGLAKTSLVLGILSIVLSVVCLGPLAGIPAIIVGHIAHRRARKYPDQYSGAGLAIAGFVTGYASLLVMELLLFLPAPKAKAQRINCANNLKQVGIAFGFWASANGDSFPFTVPINKGGTLEFSTRGADGFDSNAWRHFQVMSNELGTPKLLVCPADKSKTYATNFLRLGPDNVSYQVRSGTNVDKNHPNEVLVRCPIHNTELMCDGSVIQRPRKR